MVRDFLPPGFRFHPTDVELVLYYLKRMILGKKFHYKAIEEVNIYKYAPWDLPDKSCLKSRDLEWFFFCPREKKYASGARVKRATEEGYWKTTGKDRIIPHNEKTVGTVKTLVFHLGHAPQGERTDWVIHEYKILDDQLAKAGIQDNYVICKLFKKKGLGPKNGAQYGAPFNEADWDDNHNDDAQNCPISLADEGPSSTILLQNEEQCLPLGSGFFGSGTEPMPLVAEVPSSSIVATTSIVAAADDTNDELSHLLDSFADEDMFLSDGNGLNEDDLSGNGMNKLLHPSEGLNIYSGLCDLDNWIEMNDGGFDLSGVQNVDYSLNMLPEDNSTYIELNDLLPPLDFSNEVTGIHTSTLCQESASYSHQNMQQVYTGIHTSPLCQESVSYSQQNMQQVYTGIHTSPLCQESASYSHQNMQQVYTGTHTSPLCQESASYSNQNMHQVYTGTHTSPLCQESASYIHQNMQQVYTGTMFASMNQYTPFVSDLDVLPSTSEVDNSLDALQMACPPFYQGSNASYNLDIPFGQLENAGYSPHDMERVNSISETAGTCQFRKD